jgi:hypothetical protein
VRGLIGVVLVIGTGLGWIVREAQVQRDAVAAITSAGGWVKYDREWGNGNYVQVWKLWAPRWLVDRIGFDYFGHVRVVGLVSTAKAPDAALASVGGLHRLEQLIASDTSVSDVGLAHLKGLTKLIVLDLDGTQVTDAGLVDLMGLAKLSILDLRDTRVSDAGLEHLKRLTELSELHLAGTQVTDAGMRELKHALPSLSIRH